MILTVRIAVCGALAVASLAGQAVSPSPMEQFAQEPGSRIAWSSEAGRIESGAVRAVVTAVVVENATEPARKIRGVRINITGTEVTDEIYLDEEATVRTTTGLNQIAGGLKRFGGPHTANGCEGSLLFVVKFADYPHPWSKYHELDAAYCGMPDGAGLVLTGRGKPATFGMPGETPEHLSSLLKVALDQAKAQ